MTRVRVVKSLNWPFCKGYRKGKWSKMFLRLWFLAFQSSLPSWILCFSPFTVFSTIGYFAFSAVIFHTLMRLFLQVEVAQMALMIRIITTGSTTWTRIHGQEFIWRWKELFKLSDWVRHHLIFPVARRTGSFLFAKQSQWNAVTESKQFQAKAERRLFDVGDATSQ